MSFNAATRIQLPGFGLPLDHLCSIRDEDRVLFRNALNTHDVCGRDIIQLPLITVRELTMLHLMNSLTDKVDWHKKVFDEAITSKWKTEILSGGNDITGKMVDWCIAELQYKAKSFGATGAVSVYNGDVVKSDTAVPNSLKEDLKRAAASLEGVPVWQQDWHPGSNEKVLDLVHPSLFPLIYGRSRILPTALVSLDDCIERCGEGEIVPIPPEKETYLVPDGWHFTRPFSSQFQWLPCDVDISGGNRAVRITSYINNLHPGRNKDLYSVLEKLIACAIPLWNLTLTPLKAPCFAYYTRIRYYNCEYDPKPEQVLPTHGPQREEGEDEFDYEDRREAWYHSIRKVVQPEPGTFRPPEVRKEGDVDILRDYGDRGIQVIVKLANIHLTPDNPEYEGGTWHVEGQLNEHICATAVYYYDSENVTTSRLAFRQQCATDIGSEASYEQDDHNWLKEVFGCDPTGPGVQDIGSVDTLEGRLLTWPNILQHQVQPFRLADPTKPGHRKIVALFLVDPNIRIISTSNVPCQRRDWWSEPIEDEKGPISALPAELRDRIFGDVEDFPISLEEAKGLRVKLMEERKVYVVEHDRAFKQHFFSLCEH
ncbi:hypothetical protein Hypma_011642 [Hypsizygus marmoreus]|uniref:Uncharacterized protein n=1 Tax=Hypsizygus marmoreus TaxID=39966 RepID=A0A369JRI8_HYPMA|nr:hypothetical protein Hypma_011642 [Hypsizygus marmoreus]